MLECTGRVIVVLFAITGEEDMLVITEPLFLDVVVFFLENILIDKESPLFGQLQLGN